MDEEKVLAAFIWLLKLGEYFRAKEKEICLRSVVRALDFEALKRSI